MLKMLDDLEKTVDRDGCDGILSRAASFETMCRALNALPTPRSIRQPDTHRTGPVPIQRLDRAEIQARAEVIARDQLNTTLADAFGRLQRGELNGTLAEPELRMLRDMLECLPV